MTLEKGVNPRVVFGSKHRERGPKRFIFTYADFASFFGMTEGAVSKAVSRGDFDPSDLGSIVDFYQRRGRRHGLEVA